MKKLTYILAAIFLSSSQLIAGFAEEPIPGISVEIEKAIIKLEEAGIQTESLEIDHVTRVAASVEEYVATKNILASQGTNLFDSIFSKRAQTPYELNSPFQTAGKMISIIENASPFGGSKPGLEQMKLIVPTTVSAFVAQYPQINFDLSQLNRAGHPEASIKLNGVTYRFRELRLKQILAGRKVADHPANIAGCGIITPGILSNEQKQKLLNVDSVEMPFTTLAVGGWALTLQEISEPTKQKMNMERVESAFCISGKVRIELGDTSFTLTAGDMIQIPPGIEYRFLPSEGNAYAKVLFSSVR